VTDLFRSIKRQEHWSVYDWQVWIGIPLWPAVVRPDP
jgi:hypothetical protein